MSGTEMIMVESAAGRAVAARIRYPAADTIIALDPDIPAAAQRVVFEPSPAGGRWRWRLDGIALGSGDAHGRVDWTPVSGRHRLALENAEGEILSTAEFEVRGNASR